MFQRPQTQCAQLVSCSGPRAVSHVAGHVRCPGGRLLWASQSLPLSLLIDGRLQCKARTRHLPLGIFLFLLYSLSLSPRPGPPFFSFFFLKFLLFRNSFNTEKGQMVKRQHKGGKHEEPVGEVGADPREALGTKFIFVGFYFYFRFPGFLDLVVVALPPAGELSGDRDLVPSSWLPHRLAQGISWSKT